MATLKKWDPENEAFWQAEGRSIAKRNLWISIPSLLCGFAVWGYWGIITVQMLNAGYPFTPEALFTLTAIAGLSGATLRIPSSFLIRICGGRNTIFFTTSLLIIPALFTGIALANPDTPLWQYQLLALLSGIGGGNFASSMANIGTFFPKRQQGMALGLNAGLGNLGVTTMQILIPLFMTAGVFGLLGGEPTMLVNPSGSLLGKNPPGSLTWVQNGSYLWLIILIPLFFLTWFKMDNIATPEISPNLSSPLKSFSMISIMLLIGFITSAIGLWLMLPKVSNGSGFNIPKEIVMCIVVVLTVFIMKLLPGAIRENLNNQYEIFKNRHTWIMSILYTMTFGSFIGFAAAFPLSIQVIFGYQHMVVDGVMTHDTINPNGPSALMYAWIAPLIGAIVRPIGGWVADKVGGALVTQICAFFLAVCALAAAYYMQLAYKSATPEIYFVPFFLVFIALFAATGLGNGSTFRSVAMIFPKHQAGAVLGWTSAMAAYGAFYIPLVVGEQIRAATPQYAMLGFSVFYLVCLLLNWFFYLRKNGEFYNP